MMKKKKLTINALAGSNLKTRKKQYAIMFVGIILAMVFSSSIVLYLFSSVETGKAQAIEKFGNQDRILYTQENDISFYEQAKKDGAITDYGISHIIGYAYSKDDEELLGASIAWLDEKAKEISRFSLLEGEYPTKENEIAIEKTVLYKLGFDAEIGDEITLKVKTQNNNEYYDTNESTYKLVGIVSDKQSNYQDRYSSDYIRNLAAAFVAQETQTALGGKEKIVAYVYSDLINTIDYSKSLFAYLDNNTEDYESLSGAYYSMGNILSSISENSYLGVVIVMVLIFACCVAIINSFNTNLKERKKQIGMMRAVGATKRQIIKIFGREAFIISLICVPVSIAISYGIVWSIITLANEKAIMTKSIVVLPVSAVICLAVTMLAALVPLIFASKITPMQAIRNIDNTRKMKIKKIKSKKNFNVASHLAKRNLTFYKGGLIAVSVMLSVTIVFSSLGFSFVTHELGKLYSFDYDYEITGFPPSWGFINEGLEGISTADKYNIDAMPYVSKAVGEKEILSIVEADEFTDFHKAELNTAIYEWDTQNLTYENAETECFSTYTEEYLELKEKFDFSKEFFPMNMRGVETEILKAAEAYVADGSINLDKIASGEEIILVAPKKAKLELELGENGQAGWTTSYDDERARVSGKYEVVLEGENPYKAGDTLNISTIVYNEYSGEYTKVDKEAVIGAIIDPMKARKADDYAFGGFSIFTSISGMNNFCSNVKYSNIDIYVDEEIDDELDALLTESLSAISDKYNHGYVHSDYAYMKYQRHDNLQAFVSMLAIIIVGFTICASIVNNTLTASIREKKRTIGTLRAVGASEKDMVISFIKQLLSMFNWGYGIGFGLFTVIYLIIYAVFRYKQIQTGDLDSTFDYSFNPWLTIAFCVVLFGICSINLWLKIRKEMKNSIIDNIREL